MSVTIHAVPVNGGEQTTITIDKTGPDTGTLSTDARSFDVFNVKASPDRTKLVCNTQVFFWLVARRVLDCNGDHIFGGSIVGRRPKIVTLILTPDTITLAIKRVDVFAQLIVNALV